MKGIAKKQPGGKGKGKRMSKGGKPRLDPAYGFGLATGADLCDCKAPS
jgi:hypothetical protein